MKKFSQIRALAEKRKGGSQALSSLLQPPKSPSQLAKISDDRYLAQMTRCVFNAGFHWRVITQKWDGFEEAFHGFNLAKLLTLSPDEWENYASDTRIVRNWQKIQTVFANALMLDELAAEHGSFARFFADWPSDNQVGLMHYFKKNGSRLGGQTGQYFIRFMHKDGFITSNDVVAALIASGLDISNTPTSQRDLNKIQAAFNHWHEETGLPYTHLSKILAYTAGDNIEVETIANYSNRQSLVK